MPVPHSLTRLLHQYQRDTKPVQSQHTSRTSFRRLSVAASSATAPLVKICGLVHPEDAELAVAAGANFLGIIQSARFRRFPGLEATKQIAAVGHRAGIPVVGVFVDEDSLQIDARAAEAGLDVVQLHGDPARSSLRGISKQLQVIYVVNAGPDGSLVASPQSRGLEEELHHHGRRVDWLLVDGLNPGSGEPYDWSKVQLPEGSCEKGWLLAGGLNNTNVAQALSTVRPTAVDVSSGVAGPDGLRKDAQKMSAFMYAVQNARTK